MVPSGERDQLSARSGSTSAVVTLPSLMAKRVRPRNMNRVMAWLCPSVLEWGSRVSGSLAAMFRTFFWASACGGSTSATAPCATRSPRTTTSQLKRDMEFSSFTGRARGERDRSPVIIRDVFEGHRAERDSSMTTSVESVRTGLGDGPACVGGTGTPVKIGRYDIRTGRPLQVVAGRPAFQRGGRSGGPTHQPRDPVEYGQHRVGLRRIQVEDEPGGAGVPVALDQVDVLGDAEDRDRQARRIAAGLGDELLEIR